MMSTGAADSKSAEERQARDDELVSRNVEAICSQRDWLPWLCDMYLTFQRRCRHGTLRGYGGEDGDGMGGGGVTSMSESESSINGGYDTEDSTGGDIAIGGQGNEMSPSGGNSRRGGARDRGRSLSPTTAARRPGSRKNSDGSEPVAAAAAAPAAPHFSSIAGPGPGAGAGAGAWVPPPASAAASTAASTFLALNTHILASFLEPMFLFAQQVFLHDLRCKPIAARKIHDIINRVPIDNPEARQFQLNLLFDVLDAASVESFVDATKSMNVLRNMSSLLEQAAEKVLHIIHFILLLLLLLLLLLFLLLLLLLLVVKCVPYM
jgi:hypothetical protein